MEKIQPIVDLHICLQGEGKYAGVPHFLIRFSGCNLSCEFAGGSICDTAYASWKPEKGKYSLQDIQNLIEEYPQISHAFVTGGEPTLNPTLLQSVVTLLKSNNIFTAIESNGTRVVDIEGLDFVTISPKLKNSTPKPGTIIKLDKEDRKVTEQDMIKHEVNRSKATDATSIMIQKYPHQLKFVVTNETEMEEIFEFVKNVNAQNENIYLMPEGLTVEQLSKRRKAVMELCLQYGFNYTDRLHILAYGNERNA